jgi:hypothetical protein
MTAIYITLTYLRSENRYFLKENTLDIYLFGLTRGDLALAQEAAEETATIDLMKDPKHFGTDAFLPLVSILDGKKELSVGET